MKKILNIDYHCRKIVEAVIDDGCDAEGTDRGLGLVNVRYVSDRLGEMLGEIQASPERPTTRDLQLSLRVHFEPIEHALKFLETFLKNQSPTEGERLTATVFASYIDDKVPEIVREFGYEETDSP